MALTSEIIKANESLSNLSDEQISAITTLSVNDENSIIGGKVKDIHDQYDKDVKEITGIDRNQNEKTYDYTRRVLSDYKAKIEGSSNLQGEIAKYKTNIAELQQQIKEGKGDESIRKQLKDFQDQYGALKTQYDTDKSSWEKERQGYLSNFAQIKKDSQFEKAISGLKFKSVYPEAIQKSLLDSTVSALQSEYKIDWIKDGDKEVMIFRDQKGEVLRNKGNSLNPYTAQELIKERLKEVLETAQPVGGAGSKQPTQQPALVNLIDVGGAKTQVEADNLITKYLLQTGELRGTASFAEKQKKIREDNSVMKLPIR